MRRLVSHSFLAEAYLICDRCGKSDVINSMNKEVDRSRIDGAPRCVSIRILRVAAVHRRRQVTSVAWFVSENFALSYHAEYDEEPRFTFSECHLNLTGSGTAAAFSRETQKVRFLRESSPLQIDPALILLCAITEKDMKDSNCIRARL